MCGRRSECANAGLRVPARPRQVCGCGGREVVLGSPRHPLRPSRTLALPHTRPASECDFDCVGPAQATSCLPWTASARHGPSARAVAANRSDCAPIRVRCAAARVGAPAVTGGAASTALNLVGHRCTPCEASAGTRRQAFAHSERLPHTLPVLARNRCDSPPQLARPRTCHRSHDLGAAVARTSTGLRPVAPPCYAWAAMRATR